MLHQHPECLERLRKEVQEVVPDLSQPVTYEAIRDLAYLDAVINETQRLLPIAQFSIPRTVPEGGVELGGYYLPGNVSAHRMMTKHPHSHGDHLDGYHGICENST
jgi:cytochrome P450